MDNLRNLIREVVEGNTVFARREVLTQDYVPNTLPGREKQMKEISIYFRDLFEGSTSVSVVFVGKAGTGKSVVAKKFGKEFVEIAKEKNLRISYAHINCHKQRTLYLALTEVAKQINFDVPNRGLSTLELFKMIYDYLEKKKIFLIITFDEFDYLVHASPLEDIYLLARAYDEYNVQAKRISYIFIVRDLANLTGLDTSIKENIVKNIIEFPPYTSSELYQILLERVKQEKAFKEGAVTNEVLQYISSLYGTDTGGNGNARLAIETLELAGKIADAENSPVVTTEHAKKALDQINPELVTATDAIKELNIHELLILKAIINLRKRTNMELLPTSMIEEEYKKIANYMQIEPRKHTQIYGYLRGLKAMGLIITKQSGPGRRGRSTLISLSVPLLIDDIITKEIREKITQSKS